MSKEVKLVIEIPEKTNAHIRSDYGHGYLALRDEDKGILCYAVYHGAPYEDRPRGERKTAQYIKGGDGVWYCSSCRRIDDKYSVARFCWYCGALMKRKGEKNEINRVYE